MDTSSPYMFDLDDLSLYSVSFHNEKYDHWNQLFLQPHSFPTENEIPAKDTHAFINQASEKTIKEMVAKGMKSMTDSEHRILLHLMYDKFGEWNQKVGNNEEIEQKNSTEAQKLQPIPINNHLNISQMEDMFDCTLNPDNTQIIGYHLWCTLIFSFLQKSDINSIFSCNQYFYAIHVQNELIQKQMISITSKMSFVHKLKLLQELEVCNGKLNLRILHLRFLYDMQSKKMPNFNLEESKNDLYFGPIQKLVIENNVSYAPLNSEYFDTNDDDIFRFLFSDQRSKDSCTSIEMKLRNVRIGIYRYDKPVLCATSFTEPLSPQSSGFYSTPTLSGSTLSPSELYSDLISSNIAEKYKQPTKANAQTLEKCMIGKLISSMKYLPNIHRIRSFCWNEYLLKSEFFQHIRYLHITQFSDPSTLFLSSIQKSNLQLHGLIFILDENNSDGNNYDQYLNRMSYAMNEKNKQKNRALQEIVSKLSQMFVNTLQYIIIGVSRNRQMLNDYSYSGIFNDVTDYDEHWSNAIAIPVLFEFFHYQYSWKSEMENIFDTDYKNMNEMDGKMEDVKCVTKLYDALCSHSSIIHFCSSKQSSDAFIVLFNLGVSDVLINEENICRDMNKRKRTRKRIVANDWMSNLSMKTNSLNLVVDGYNGGLFVYPIKFY